MEMYRPDESIMNTFRKVAKLQTENPQPFNVTFEHNGATIYNPFMSECGRFEVDPLDYYGESFFNVWMDGVSVWEVEARYNDMEDAKMTEHTIIVNNCEEIEDVEGYAKRIELNGAKIISYGMESFNDKTGYIVYKK